jgi:hypothetical protein
MGGGSCSGLAFGESPAAGLAPGAAPKESKLRRPGKKSLAKSAEEQRGRPRKLPVGRGDASLLGAAPSIASGQSREFEAFARTFLDGGSGVASLQRQYGRPSQRKNS